MILGAALAVYVQAAFYVQSHLEATATMTTNNNPDPLFADAGLPFGHPGHRFDDTPEYFDHSPLVDQGPEPVHYAPGDRPLCGNESITAVYTDEPAGVTDCAECLKLVTEDLQDHNDYGGHCLHCRGEITAQGGGSNGAGWSGGYARTAGSPDGNDQQGPR